MLGKTLNEILYNFGEETVRLLTESIERNKATATRNLRQSIKYWVKILGNEFIFILEMADYWEWVDKGRGATKSRSSNGETLQDRIYKWIPFKGFPLRAKAKKLRKRQRKKKTLTQIIDRERKSLAYLIARKIHKKGYKGSNFYSDVVTPNYIDDLKSELRTALKRDVEIEIVELFKELKR